MYRVIIQARICVWVHNIIHEFKAIRGVETVCSGYDASVVYLQTFGHAEVAKEPSQASCASWFVKVPRPKNGA